MRSLVKRLSRMLMAAPRRSGSPRTAQMPASRCSAELVLHHDGVAVRSGETHADAVVRETVALDQHLARVLGDVDADVAGLDRGRLQAELLGAQQDARGLAIANAQSFDGDICARDVEHRAARQRARIDLGIPARAADETHAAWIRRAAARRSRA